MIVGSSSAGRCVTSDEEHAVLAAFLGDAGEGAAGGAEADGAVGGGVAVRLLADEEQRHRAVAPEAEVEGEAAEHADHGVDHFDRQPRELHDGHRLAVGLEPEEVAQEARHRVAADARVLEHEGVARVVLDGLDPRHQAMIVHARRAVLELAHPLIDEPEQVLEEIGHGRIDAEAGALGVGLLEREPVGRGAVALVRALRDRDELGEDLELLRRPPGGRHR